jgi:hypothetical protein
VPRERLGPAEHAKVLAFLGALGAALRGAADVAAAWAYASPLPGLRGGLRAIASRVATHATLVGDRLLALGGRPGATTLSGHTLATARDWYGAASYPDDRKLTRFLDPAGPSRAPVDAIERFTAELAEDVETREMLRLVGTAEAASLAWLTAYRGVPPRRNESARR